MTELLAERAHIDLQHLWWIRANRRMQHELARRHVTRDGTIGATVVASVDRNVALDSRIDD